MPECSQNINFWIQKDSQHDHFESQNGSKMSSGAQIDLQDGQNQKMIKNGAQLTPNLDPFLGHFLTKSATSVF